MSEQENVKVVQQVYADFGQGNIPAILSALADDVEWNEPPAGPPPFAGTYHGRKEVEEFFSRLGEVAEVEHFEPQEFFSEGDVVVALGNYRFRARATGKPWTSDWTMVWRFQQGKVTRFQIYKDSAAEVAALRGS